MARPQAAPRIAAPPPRSAPAIQRQAPASRDAVRIERRQQIIQQRQQSVQPRSAPTSSTAATGVPPQRLQQLESRRNLSRNERRELQQLQRDQRQSAQKIQSTDPNKTAVSGNQQRLQQLESKGRLTRTERQELRTLKRDERQNAQQNLTGDQQKTAATGNQQRIQELQSKGRLTRNERQELRTLQRDERRNAQQNLTADQQKTATTGNQQRIQELQSKGRLTRNERRELRQLQRDERQNARLQERQQQTQQQQNSQTAADRQSRRAQRQAVSAQQVSQGRFASNLSANYNGRRAGRRAARLAALTAWQLGVLAPYVPWRGPVYWPYAYNDVFYYTFWPEAYDSAYWAYAYDDFFDGVFFPDGAPYVEYAAEGPYDNSYARTSTTGAAPRSAGGGAPGRVNQATRDFCADQTSGITEWPLGKIADAVRPTDEQKTLLENLRKASLEAAAQFRDSCPESVPMTPPGRLQAMTQRLQAASDTVGTVKPALEAFYTSLTDEQKARFNEIGPQLVKPQRPQRTAEAGNAPSSQANCSSEKAGLSNIAIDRIEDSIQPTAAQEAALDRLDEALQKSVEILRDACPNTIPMTPVGRLEVMKQRLDAMIQAANAVRPALEDFYAALSDEQKAKFNRLGRQTAQSGG
ncbi:MAG TPA: Spy/CpxP family protein refolding chaperone [Xanthobacteraceae bacterium]